MCEVALDHASETEAFYLRTYSELFFAPRIVEVATDQSIASTLPLSYTTQFLPAEGTALSVFIARMKRP